MHLLSRGERDLSEAAVTVARQSQALAVECVDRVARTFPHRDPTPLGRLWSWQLWATSALAKEPSALVDDAYALSERLLALHRQFAQRLFEAIDTRQDDASGGDDGDEQLASVTSLVPRRR